MQIPSPAATTTTGNGSDNTGTETTQNKRWFHLVNDSFTEKQLGGEKNIQRKQKDEICFLCFRTC